MFQILDLFTSYNLSDSDKKYILDNFTETFQKFKMVSNKRNCEIWEDKVFNGLTTDELSQKFNLSKTSISSICKSIESGIIKSAVMFMPDNKLNTAIDACRSAKETKLKETLLDCLNSGVDIPEEVRTLDISNIGLKIESVNCLKKNNIDTYDQLSKLKVSDANEFNYMTKDIIQDIKIYLAKD